MSVKEKIYIAVMLLSALGVFVFGFIGIAQGNLHTGNQNISLVAEIVSLVTFIVMLTGAC